MAMESQLHQESISIAPLPPSPSLRAEMEEKNPPETMLASHSEKEKKARRRAREVSSRYMITASVPSSPVSSSNVSDGTHFAFSPKCPPTHHAGIPIPKNHLRSHRWPPASVPSSPRASDAGSEPSSCFADENQQGVPGSEGRSLETPLVLGIQGKAIGTQRKRAVRLFSDNAGEHLPPSLEHSKVMDGRLQSRKQRPGTPMINAGDRTSNISNATPRLTLLSQNLQRSMGIGRSSGRRITAHGGKSELATPAPTNHFRLEDDGVIGSSETSPENSTVAYMSDADTCSMSSIGGFCDSPPIHASKTRTVSEIRSSMPEADVLPTMSTRRSADGGLSRQDADFVHRSLNMAFSSCQHINNLSKSISRPPFSSRPPSGTLKFAVGCLPPQPPNGKLETDFRREKKAMRLEVVHSLRVLENRYVQWRFMNAKAEVAMHAKEIAAEKSLYGASNRISELQDSITIKKLELEKLKKMKDLSTILQTQMPYLDEWAILEEEYSSSLLGAIKALQDASLRLPTTGNVRADIKEISEAFDSATKMVDAMSPCVENFLPKAEGMENVISDLARVVSSERTLIEECGDLLSEAHKLQAKDCSLRSQLMQLKRTIIT